jgi:hypothetical protein
MNGKSCRPKWVPVLVVALVAVAGSAAAWAPLPVAQDPLVRMPGTQPDQGVAIEGPNRCLNCHAGYDTAIEPGFNWKGSMMAHSARDFLFWSCMTVAGQDSIWALGNPNAVDLCERCHFPKGWLGGRSDPPNASAMTGSDYDGVQCDFCHRMWNPYFEDTQAGTRESSDWLNYWDETNASSTPSQPAANATYDEDQLLCRAIDLFNGQAFFGLDNRPFSIDYTENASGQYFVSDSSQKRASFADAAARHQMLYSRYHKSKYFCATCHDVSNPALANLGEDGTQPLTSEIRSAHSYFHVERTFSEFMLSDYGRPGGAPGIGPFAPAVFSTSDPANYITKCQDCHMRDVVGEACNKRGVPIRPDQSIEHPLSGQPLHDLTGGNVWVSSVLASAIPGSPNYDPVNDQLLHQGSAVLTLDLTQGEGVDPIALLAGAERAKQQLELAASIQNLQYNPTSGALSFRIQNQTGHKLISGFPEGRRMFANIKAYHSGQLIYEVNPYDSSIGTLKGLEAGYSPNSPPLGANEQYEDALVYEMHPTSAVTAEEETFHFVLATGRYKDNRIPPKGFRINEAAARLSDPADDGSPAPDLYTSAEYAGGYDDVALTIASGADAVEVNLYYQTTSREYVEFLRDEINGTSSTLNGVGAAGDPPYLVQTDPFFGQLKAWGNTIWQLWDHNKNLPGAAPFLMAQATFGNAGGGCSAPVPTLLQASPGQQQVALTWSDVHTGDPGVTGYRVYYDQAGKAQFVAATGLVTTYTDSGLTNGQQYCYKVTSEWDSTGDGSPDCESDYSNVLCAVPNNQGQAQVGVSAVETGRYEVSGKGKNQTTTFVLTDTFTAGDAIVIRSHVVDASTGLPVANATVDIEITGPETVSLTSAASDSAVIAEATWQTSAPKKHGQVGTSPGTYTTSTRSVTASGYTWDQVPTSTTFTVQ